MSSFLPLQESPVPDHARSLIDTFMHDSYWIWTSENSSLYPPPLAPGNSQRAFRRTWINSSPSSKVASSTTILITADNSFELFVNGALLHAQNSSHVWHTPLLFTVPISADVPDKVTYAIRAVNAFSDSGAPLASAAGVRATIKIDFSSPSNAPSEVFHTGPNQNWVSSHIFGSGWEQAQFDDSQWEAAKEMPATVNGGPVWWMMNQPTQLNFATSVPSTLSSDCPAPTPSDSPIVDAGSRITFLRGELAGTLFGVILVAGSLGALVSFLMVRRRYTLGKVF
ncbi:hypothetical protein FA13DRAFT_1738863 [Coprinellus micaceus]|uniref:Uncharacterized protein n=1 Tax=Coprinellus micaceus TaxID=71717 RepID=A0A4Y7ST06_COPMI|nr:hypothetical protein FA13DRAFT_1738863 [Coprinellus micaceus]